MATKQTIAKNTLFLYFRMFLIMGITLYTSRIVLEELGISNYGIYNLVGGIVAMIGFFNAAMSSATQRYLAHDIGKGNFKQLKKTFSAALTIHFGISILGLFIAETLGLWYINYKMVYPIEKTYVVNVIYQLSLLTFLLSIIQVPYNALIIAHERMKVFAYMSILEAILKLGTVFILMLISTNKLILYAFLIFIVSLIVNIIYQVYCRNHFQESRFQLVNDKLFFIELISYSGWNLFGNIAAVAKGQGINLILNLFFGTIVNAAYGVTNQVVGAVGLFSSNLQMAFNPQIIIQYTQGKINDSQKLIIQSSKYSYLLMLLLIFPFLLNADYILVLWLKEVPNYTNLFVQLALVNVLIDCFSGSLMTGIQATGKIKWYQIIVGILVFINLPLSYFSLKLGYSPNSIYMISIIISLISLNFRLYFLKIVMNFSISNYYKSVIINCLIVTFLGFISIYLLRIKFPINGDFIQFIIQSFLLDFLLLAFIFLIGLNRLEKVIIIQKIKYSLKQKQ